MADLSADGFAKRLRLELPDDLLPYVVERGSIAIEGVSLTIADLAGSSLEVSLIPETLERTTLGALEPGDRVNVECDVLARYVRRQLPTEPGMSPLSSEGAPQAEPRSNPMRSRTHVPDRGIQADRDQDRYLHSPRSRRRSRTSAAAGWSSSATTRTVRTRAT